MVKTVKYGLLGTATIAERAMISGMDAAKNSEFYAVAGRKKEKVDRFVEQYGISKGYYSYEELLDDPEIDAVYIPLPNNMHYAWAIKAMKKGKHVLCEKPLACTHAEAEEMFRVAQECNVVLMEAFPFLHSPLIDRFKELIKSGEMGKLVLFECSFFTLKHPPTNVRMQRSLLGGAMYDLGCYPTSLLLYLFDGEMPIEIKSTAHFEGGIDDIMLAHLSYNDEKKAVISVGMCSSYRFGRLNLYCEKANILYEDTFNAKGEVTYQIQTADGRKTVAIDVPDNYALEIDRMTDCILYGKELRVHQTLSLNNAKLIDMVLNESGYNDYAKGD